MGGPVRADAGDTSAAAPALATDLTGDLPCIGCRYNLRGLSIRAVCPECGTAVRATILARVDPRAEELRALRRPRVAAYGLILWAWGAIAAAGCVWVVRLGDLLNATAGAALRLGLFVDLSFLAVGLSAVGACALVRPVSGPRDDGTWKAAGAVALYGVLLVVQYALLEVYDGRIGVPFLWSEEGDPSRSWIRLASLTATAAIILGLRPNALALAERSLVMRTGRVDTQPMPALIAALGVAAGGDAMLIAFAGVHGTVGALVTILALVLIAVGSFLFTLGLVGVGVDTLRLRPVLLEPAPGLSDVLAEDPPDGHPPAHGDGDRDGPAAPRA